jgi:hypothetical protein
MSFSDVLLCGVASGRAAGWTGEAGTRIGRHGKMQFVGLPGGFQEPVDDVPGRVSPRPRETMSLLAMAGIRADGVLRRFRRNNAPARDCPARGLPVDLWVTPSGVAGSNGASYGVANNSTGASSADSETRFRPPMVATAPAKVLNSSSNWVGG